MVSRKIQLIHLNRKIFKLNIEQVQYFNYLKSITTEKS